MQVPVLDSGDTAARHRRIMRCRATMHLRDGASVSVRTIDISTMGLSLMSPQTLSAGQVCELRFELAVKGKLHDIRAGARVVYNTCQGVEGFRLGLAFTEPDAARTALINCLN